MITNFKDFLANVIIEELHPELQTIATSKSGYKSKQSLLAAKIRDLTSRGEKTGIEGGMPKGSSRAYMQHEDKHPIMLDGKPQSIPIGTKVAIRAQLDKFHNHKQHDGLSLGAMQNEAEGGDYHINSHYRILTKDEDRGRNHYTTNPHGIFPPLIDHDHDNHEHTTVGHCRDIKSASEFSELTKHPDFPKGITHKDFCSSLNRFHEKNNGRYWDKGSATEAHLDKVAQHPLVQKFIDFHGNYGHPTYDYQQKKNLGVFEHPDGSKHIVARDHGFTQGVSNAYTNARQKAWSNH